MVYNFKGKSKLVAVNHASIRYWDLRFSSDENCEKDVMPDVYAVNGDDSKQKLLNENYPIEKINKIEALRYFHILSDTKQNKKFENENNILLVSDYSDKSNENLLQAIGKIEKNILSNYKFTLKEQFVVVILSEHRRHNWELVKIWKDIKVIHNKYGLHNIEA